MRMNFIRVLRTSFVVIFSLLFVCNALSAETEKIPVGDYEFWGCFSKPCITYPDEFILFGFSSRVSTRGYYFMGRTGEKTFDIMMSDTDLPPRGTQIQKDKIYHVSFSPNDRLYLFHTNPFRERGCTENDNIYLKMLELKGNQLKFQIILPACLKK